MNAVASDRSNRESRVQESRAVERRDEFHERARKACITRISLAQVTRCRTSPAGGKGGGAHPPRTVGAPRICFCATHTPMQIKIANIYTRNAHLRRGN